MGAETARPVPKPFAAALTEALYWLSRIEQMRQKSGCGQSAVQEQTRMETES